jgi:hypothetical protein
MKRPILLILNISLIFAYAFSQVPDYADGNGSIIERSIESGTVFTLRKHEQNVFVSDETSEDRLIVYNEHDKISGKQIKTLSRNTYMDIHEIFSRDALATGWNETWLKITTQDEINGWVFLGNEDPYRDDNWKIIGKIDSSGKLWTIRKLEQGLAIWETTDVRDRPGIESSKILFKLIIPSEATQLDLRTLAATEENDSINSITDYWAEIQDGSGRIGWMFCGNATVERGGPKYLTPEHIINSYFAVP